MCRLAHASCGFSEFAPGCDDAACLLHRIEVSVARAWEYDALQARLDEVVDVAASYLLGVPAQLQARDRA